jgi:hypothetical protein
LLGGGGLIGTRRLGPYRAILPVLWRHPYPRLHFATVEELRLALIAFQRTYNQTWIIERHGYKTPAQFRDDQIGPMPMAA